MEKLPKIIFATKKVAEAGWNKHLPVPLTEREPVIVVELKPKEKGKSQYLKVKHGLKGNKVVSTFGLEDFEDKDGKRIKV